MAHLLQHRRPYHFTHQKIGHREVVPSPSTEPKSGSSLPASVLPATATSSDKYQEAGGARTPVHSKYSVAVSKCSVVVSMNDWELRPHDTSEVLCT